MGLGDLVDGISGVGVVLSVTANCLVANGCFRRDVGYHGKLHSGPHGSFRK